MFDSRLLQNRFRLSLRVLPSYSTCTHTNHKPSGPGTGYCPRKATATSFGLDVLLLLTYYHEMTIQYNLVMCFGKFPIQLTLRLFGGVFHLLKLRYSIHNVVLRSLGIIVSTFGACAMLQNVILCRDQIKYNSQATKSQILTGLCYSGYKHEIWHSCRP